MKYLVVLTATEAKKFIAKSLVKKNELFKKALNGGMVILHPSTSTSFIYEELMRRKPEGLCFIGAISAKGTCISSEFEEIAAQRKKGFDQRDTTYSWVFNKGQFTKGITLGEVLSQMGPGDIYVKGVNVIDSAGNAGVLTANPDGGTITRAMANARQRNFTLMLIATMNKLIHGSIEEAAKVAGRDKLDGAMGIPTSLFKVNGNLITEREAFQMQGVQSTPIASGGLREAEGAFVFVVEGSRAEIKSCLEVISECKGAQSDVYFPDCELCRYEKCNLSTVNQGVPEGVWGVEKLSDFIRNFKK